MVESKNYNKDLKNYIDKYGKILELAQRFKTSPGAVVEMFFSVGLEALKQTESIMKNEFESKLNELFPGEVPADVRKKITTVVDNLKKITIDRS